MPSASLWQNRSETNQQWDGQWVQVDAIVRGVRQPPDFPGLKQSRVANNLAMYVLAIMVFSSLSISIKW